MTRGLVLPLSQQQRLARLLYLGGLATIDKLDQYVRRNDVERSALGYSIDATHCLPFYYRLNGEKDGLAPYNGGKDPTALDPADRWSKPRSLFVNRTCDCIGGMSWVGGWDRYQERRFPLYKGWINTDSMIMDASSRTPRCFRRLDRPELGCYVVCASGSRGHDTGHIGGVYKLPAEWDAAKRESWLGLGVIDVASRGGGVRANQATTGIGWFNTGALFVVPAFAA